MEALLSAVLFCSGAAAVAFQTLWFRQAGLVLGNTVWASSIVLASFMAGLALGNAVSVVLGDRLRRPLLTFALLECAIGVTGVAIVAGSFGLPGWLAPALRPFAESPMALGALRLSVAFALLLVPATAMGLTLPLLVRVLVEQRAQYGEALGRLYGWNTLGAMFGAVAGDAFLIAKVGVVGAALAAAGCNLLAAAGGVATLRLWRRTDARSPSAAPPSDPTPASAVRSGAGLRALLAAAFLAGGIFLALEVVWFRFLALFVHTDTLAFSLLLAVVLGGIGSGGVAASRWMARDPDAPRFAAALACVCGVLCVAAYAGFQLALAPFDIQHVADVGGVLYLATCLMLPSAFATGVLFPLLGAAAKRGADSPARATGRFVLANTLGSAAGPLVGGFVLLPQLGMERSFLGLAAAYALVALLAAGGRLRALLMPGLVGLGLALVLFPSGLMQDVYLAIPVKRLSPDGSEEVIATREGVTETITYLRSTIHGEPAAYRLVTNGYSMSGTSFAGRRYMKLFVYLPVALNPEIRHALLISFGVGSTAKALVDTPGMESVDVVDVSRDVLELSALTRSSPQDDPLRDHRVRAHVEDGRFFLQVTDRRFDLITGEPPPPKMAGIVYLYTQEYFQLVHDRLTEQGLATYWLPVHSLAPSDTKAIVAAFCAVFEDCTLWNGMNLDWVLMGSRGRRSAPSEAAFRRQWNDPTVGAELRSLAIEVPEQLGALFMADAEGLRARSAGVPPLTDHHPLRLSPFAAAPDAFAPEYRTWADTERARARFAQSDWVTRTWPPALRTASLPYFRYQSWFNDMMQELRGVPHSVVGSMDRVHQLLTTTSLEVLPRLLLQGPDADEIRIVHDLVDRGRRDPALEKRLGLESLSQRRYADAAEQFRASAPQGAPAFEALALALAGRDADARAVVARVRAMRATHFPDATERAYWRWFASVFELPDPYATGS
jgi:predicted membrane-bound spermidine synthase